MFTRKTKKSFLAATSLLAVSLLGGTVSPAGAVPVEGAGVHVQAQSNSSSPMDPRKGYQITPVKSETPGEFHFSYKIGADVSIISEGDKTYLVSGAQKEELPTTVTSSDGYQVDGTWTHEGDQLIFHQSTMSATSKSTQVNTYLTDEQVKCIQKATITGTLSGALTGPQGAALGGLGSFVGSSVACQL